MSISKEAVEAAKKAMQEVTPPPGVTKAEWFDRHGNWALIAGAIAAAAPIIRAEALEDAAKDLAQLVYVRPDHSARAEYERVLAVRRGNTDAWLKARAAAERGTDA